MVAAKAMFGSCRYVIEEILPRFGIAHTLVDGDDVAQWARRDAARDAHVVSGDAVQSDACPSSISNAVAKIAARAGAQV